MSLPERKCEICGTIYIPRRYDQITCGVAACKDEHRRRWLAAYNHRDRSAGATTGRRRSKPAGRPTCMGVLRPYLHPVLCKCPACGMMHPVKMIPPKSGITPRIYCPLHENRREMDVDSDPYLGAYAVGWRRPAGT